MNAFLWFSVGLTVTATSISRLINTFPNYYQHTESTDVLISSTFPSQVKTSFFYFLQKSTEEDKPFPNGGSRKTEKVLKNNSRLFIRFLKKKN